MTPTDIAPPGGMFARLRQAASRDWESYVSHPFVAGMTNGSLPEPAFRRYLVQDYLFLIHFSRAYALAVLKSETVAEMREKAAGLDALLNHEMKLHVAYCADWGIPEAEIEAEPEAPETMAYTRYVIDRGVAGDMLDLEVALAPCVIGYAEIANRMSADPGFVTQGNRYVSWHAMYAGSEYQDMARAAVARLDTLSAKRGGEARFDSLARTFAEASRLEARFWQMGWNEAAPAPPGAGAI